MVRSKVLLKDVKTVLFHAGAQTVARRTEPLPQLTCIGKACKVFQPEIVQCTNMGEDDTGSTQWRCDADMPNGFRFGKIEVSCEGWSKPGDRFITPGSCALEYNLYQSNPGLYDSSPSVPSSTERIIDKLFKVLFYAVTFVLLYTLFRSIFNRFFPRHSLPSLSSFFPPSDGPGHGHGHHHHGWGSGGPGPGFNPGPSGGGPPPPPYTKDPEASRGGGMGLWTGLAAGGLAGYLAGRSTGAQAPRPPAQVRQRPRRSLWEEDEDRGVGPSQPREMRRATGFGGTNVR
ncbi:hypothetical protein BD324DRAFT_526643 [Kockovaella imperatae]|uniref:Store-operated calcium entry-associated regulatory factor n=1 Tax=Kockovaella imperatae TaxID=4999 RepID=A0A1Y1UGF2_9TREE|nr:hypothetical protein BD324DRAFT_526643 [Kockovaella imperatae]ORX36145.1 hypothetical protein BD324DRAFT_526643 [Kockovaella imperatae]